MGSFKVCSVRLHAQHGDALNEIELQSELERTISALQSGIAKQGNSKRYAVLQSDLCKLRDQVLKAWKVAKRAESKERIAEALNRVLHGSLSEE